MSNDEVKEALKKIKYRAMMRKQFTGEGGDDVERVFETKPLIEKIKSTTWILFVPRKLPQRPRKMLPLIVGIDPEEEKEEIASEILTPEQKGKQRIKQIKAYPRLFGTKTHNPIDGKVSQVSEKFDLLSVYCDELELQY
ncbi:hypothetical protein COOONC_03234 [Cooperia oncophora]